MTAKPSSPSDFHAARPPDGLRPHRRAAYAAAAVPAALLLVDVLADKRAAMPLWAWGEWKVFLVGLLWSFLFWAVLLFWGTWLARKAGLRRLPAFALAAIFSAWIGFAYFASYKYLRDMYHLPNVHILQFTLYESANAWELAKEVLRWWHCRWRPPASPPRRGCSGTGLLAAGHRLQAMRALWRRLLHGGLTAAFLGLSILTLGWHRYQDPLPWDANWHRMFFQYGLMLGGNTTNLRVAQRSPLPAQPGQAPPQRPHHPERVPARRRHPAPGEAVGRLPGYPEPAPVPAA